MKKRTKFLAMGVGAVCATFAIMGSACESSVNNDQNATDKQLQAYEKNQPLPNSTFSEYRQTLLEVEQAEIHGTTTTSFFYNLGSKVPIKSCPSVGFPIPSDTELTNPEQAISGPVTVGQADPTGVYAGASTGTYVVCVLANGTKRIDYWEGYVETEGGPAHFDPASGQVVDDSGSTVKLSK